MGLEKNFKILEDVVDVMAQIIRSVEDIIHYNRNIKRFQEMLKTPKKKKKVRGEGLDSKSFSISKNSGPYLVLKDVGSQKVHITIK